MSRSISWSPGQICGERLNQLDVRFARPVRAGRTRSTFQLDLYNALNVDAVTGVNSSYAVMVASAGRHPGTLREARRAVRFLRRRGRAGKAGRAGKFYKGGHHARVEYQPAVRIRGPERRRGHRCDRSIGIYAPHPHPRHEPAPIMPPSIPAANVVNLMTPEGVATLSAQWKNMDVKIVDAPPMPNAGAAWKVLPMTSSPTPANPAMTMPPWPVIDAKSLADRRGGGRLVHDVVPHQPHHPGEDRRVRSGGRDGGVDVHHRRLTRKPG